MADVVPASDDAADVDAARRQDGAMTRWFLGPTFGHGYPADMVAWYAEHGFLDGLDLDAVADAEPIDFLAVNYYRRERVAAAPVVPAWGIGAQVLNRVGEFTGNGWEVWPDGLRTVLLRIHADYAPTSMAITENGATFPDPPVTDGRRRRRGPSLVRYLARHIAAAADAIDGGVPVDRVLRVVALRQLRVGAGLQRPVRDRARRLRHAAPHGQGQWPVVRRLLAAARTRSGG